MCLKTRDLHPYLALFMGHMMINIFLASFGGLLQVEKYTSRMILRVEDYLSYLTHAQCSGHIHIPVMNDFTLGYNIAMENGPLDDL
jgi:hypothetical protein